jgi:hypothetical protein
LKSPVFKDEAGEIGGSSLKRPGFKDEREAICTMWFLNGTF